MTDADINAVFARAHAVTGHSPLIPNRVAELEHALAKEQQLCAFLSDQNAKLYREVQLLRRAKNDPLMPSRDMVERYMADPMRCMPSERVALEAQGFTAAFVDPNPPPATATKPGLFPARAMRQHHQTIGLLTTPDAGRRS